MGLQPPHAGTALVKRTGKVPMVGLLQAWPIWHGAPAHAWAPHGSGGASGDLGARLGENVAGLDGMGGATGS